MLSINYCENILNKKGKKYDKEEIKIIRDFLYSLANIDKENFINLNHAKSSSIHKGIN